MIPESLCLVHWSTVLNLWLTHF